MDVKKSLKSLTRSPARRAAMEGDGFRDVRDWSSAARAYAQAVELEPEWSAIWVQYGHALKETGDRDRAEAAYRSALAIDQSNADTHLQLGHLLKIGGRFAEAGEAYMTALELDNGLSDALRELQDLAARGAPVPAARFEAVMDRMAAPALSAPPVGGNDPTALADALKRLRVPGLSEEDLAILDDAAARLRGIAEKGKVKDAEKSGGGDVLVFDASALVHYFRHSRLPTGIQRVSLEIIRSIVLAEEGAVEICAAYHERWVHIPTSLFMLLTELATIGSHTQDPDWRTATSRLEIALASDRSYQFPEGACLVNLGTSWHSDYLLKIRNAKRDHRIRFIPFVHDLIPVVTPQFVLADLTTDFVAWLLAVFDHADLFLCNSRSTQADLIAAAHKLGHALGEDDIVVVPLDAQFSASRQGGDSDRNFLRARGLHGQPFALFVSTVEPRKNHLAAINAWAELLPEFGAKMPRLVCVGARGWMNEEIFQRVASDELLSHHVIFLHGISDAELAACYDSCLFTVFPSHYEGWGLPVTESLCHGKVPVLSDSSSLPEAGGSFAVYFERGSQSGLVAALRRLIGDPDHRLELERKIASDFAPRTWDQLGEQISAAIAARFRGIDPNSGRSGVAAVQLGSVYSFARNSSRRLLPGQVSGAALRSGAEWHEAEEWGSWARGALVEITGQLPASTWIRAFVGVRGMPGAAANVVVTIDGQEVLETPLPGSETRWLPLAFQASEGPTRIELRVDRVQSLAAVTNGEDGRTVGPGLLGFYACRADDLGQRLAFLEALATGVIVPGALDAPRTALAMVGAEMASAPQLDIDQAPETPVEDAVPRADVPLPGTRSRLPEDPIVPNNTRGEIVLLQSSDAEIYAPMLEQSARTTRAYAEKHGYRYDAFVGIKRGILPWHASYNRIDMLMALIADDFQGWVFYIDADAWIADLDFDLAAYLSDKARYALIAAPAGHYRDQYWNVNNGVVLFNLGHPFARAFIIEWERFLSRYDVAAEAKSWNVEITDDQGMFHQILDKLPYAADHILIENKELLNSPWATFVRHAIRAENADFSSRLALVTAEVDKVLEEANQLGAVAAG
jgi:glycosyltransferase involved in cell wall biosynthesis